VFGRIEVQAYDELKFFNEMCIVGKFEWLDPMRLESMSAPDAGNGRSAGALMGSQDTRAPVRRACRNLIKRDPHRLFHVGRIVRGARTTRARRILKQSIDASSEKARPPERYNSATNVKLLRDVLIHHSGRSQQHHNPSESTLTDAHSDFFARLAIASLVNSSFVRQANNGWPVSAVYSRHIDTASNAVPCVRRCYGAYHRTSDKPT